MTNGSTMPVLTLDFRQYQQLTHGHFDYKDMQKVLEKHICVVYHTTVRTSNQHMTIVTAATGERYSKHQRGRAGQSLQAVQQQAFQSCSVEVRLASMLHTDLSLASVKVPSTGLLLWISFMDDCLSVTFHSVIIVSVTIYTFLVYDSVERDKATTQRHEQQLQCAGQGI